MAEEVRRKPNSIFHPWGRCRRSLVRETHTPVHDVTFVVASSIGTACLIAQAGWRRCALLHIIVSDIDSLIVSASHVCH